MSTTIWSKLFPWLRQPYQPTGQFSVGIRDITYSQDRTLHPDKHLSARIFYPAAATPQPWWSPVCFWLPHRHYAYGYSYYLFFWAKDKGLKYILLKQVVRTLILILGSSVALAATWCAPLAGEEAAGAEGLLSTPRTTPGANSATPEATPQQQAPHSQDPDLDQQQGQSGDQSTSPGRSRSRSHSSSRSHSYIHSYNKGQRAFPLVLFSHGLAGTRNTYSSICVELASQGFVVVAVEHADGTASTAHLARVMEEGTEAEVGVTLVSGSRWVVYQGLGPKESWPCKARWRVRELQTALRLMTAMGEGFPVEGLRVSGCGHHPEHLLAGRLDLSRVTVMGHSFGGSTAALAASEHPEFHAAVALDPWWDALPADCEMMLHSTWSTLTPMLVIGSHDWNKPNAKGELACNGERQASVLRAAGDAAGAVLLVPRGSTHHSYDDVLLFFGGTFKPLLQAFNFHAQLSAREGLDIVNKCSLHFIRTALDLPAPDTEAAQRTCPPCMRPVPPDSLHAQSYPMLCGGEERIAELQLYQAD